MRALTRALLTAAILVTAMACAGGEEPSRRAPQQSVAITSPAQGASIKGNVVRLELGASGILILPAQGQRSSRTGHFHVFVDADPPPVGSKIETGPGIIHSAESSVSVYGLARGEHRLVAVLGDGQHYRLPTTPAEVGVNVEGPSVRGTVAGSAAAALDVAVEGVTLAPAASDHSFKAGTHGHLHVLVDREPPAAGQPIPSGDPDVVHTADEHVLLPKLSPGSHTVWVVLGYADHTPFDPAVADRVTFTVS